MDIMTLVTRLLADGSVARITRNRLAQFGPNNRRYLGATLLPERNVPQNEFIEDTIRYRTVIANDGTRYSPVQLKADNALVGQFLVVLGNQDIGRQFTGRDYDAFLDLLNRNSNNQIAGGGNVTQRAMATLLNWVDITVNRALIEVTEKQRWDAIVNAAVVRTGDNGFTETVNFPNPSGHRVAAGGVWSGAYDPYPDIIAMAQLLWDKGYTLNRIITSRKVTGILANNSFFIDRTTGRLFVNNTGGVVTQPTGRTTVAGINGLFNADGLPNIETYDLTYYDQAGSNRFMPDDVMVFVASTGRDEVVNELNFATNNQLDVITDTLGYTAIGRPTGESGPGRVVRLWPHDDKPPRIKAEGWQTSFPVLTEPEAVCVITGIS